MENFQLDTLALIGLTIAAAFIVGQFTRRIGVPQVVGFLVAGVLLGPSFLHAIPDGLNESLTFVSEIALGLIGFEMGGHLRFDDLRKLGKSIVWIVVMQAMAAFVLVGVGVYLITGSDYTALLFAALATASAPATTVDVLNEYQAEGPLTTTLLTVIGIGDGLSLLLFSFSAAVAETLLVGDGTLSLVRMIELPLIEIGGSFLVGAVVGWLMSEIMKRLPIRHDSLVLPIGIGLFAAGLANTLHLSLVLTTMVMGMVVINREKAHGEFMSYLVDQVGPVIYVLFFVLAGARLRLDLLPTLGLLGVAYIVLRIIGKYSGSWIGAQAGGASPLIRNYLGLALISQAGVAIGLALESQARFAEFGASGEALGMLVLNIVTATMLFVQILGPILVKFVITRAGEVGKASDETPSDAPRRQVAAAEVSK